MNKSRLSFVALASSNVSGERVRTPATFVDISALRACVCVTYYVTVKNNQMYTLPPSMVEIYRTRKRGNCECIATRDSPSHSTPAPSHSNYHAMPSLKSLDLYIAVI